MKKGQNSKGAASSSKDYLNSPCSLSEAVQIARGVAADMLSDYDRDAQHLRIAMSIQVEMIKEILIQANLITEDEFKAQYIKLAKELDTMHKQSQEAQVSNDNPSMKPTANEIDVKVEKGNKDEYRK